MCCAIWYHLCNLKNIKNINGGVLLFVKLQAKACSFTKSNLPPVVFFKWYQIAQRITYGLRRVKVVSLFGPWKEKIPANL